MEGVELPVSDCVEKECGEETESLFSEFGKYCKYRKLYN